MITFPDPSIVGAHCTIACLPVSHPYKTPSTVNVKAVGRAPLAIGANVPTLPPALVPILTFGDAIAEVRVAVVVDAGTAAFTSPNPYPYLYA
jgi:hypothetical protein